MKKLILISLICVFSIAVKAQELSGTKYTSLNQVYAIPGFQGRFWPSVQDMDSVMSFLWNSSQGGGGSAIKGAPSYLPVFFPDSFHLQTSYLREYNMGGAKLAVDSGVLLSSFDLRANIDIGNELVRGTIRNPVNWLFVTPQTLFSDSGKLGSAITQNAIFLNTEVNNGIRISSVGPIVMNAGGNGVFSEPLIIGGPGTFPGTFAESGNIVYWSVNGNSFTWQVSDDMANNATYTLPDQQSAQGTVLTVVNNKRQTEFLFPSLRDTAISLTSAQILSLNTSPVTLIPSPGIGNFIQVISVEGFETTVSMPYSAFDSLAIEYPSATSYPIYVNSNLISANLVSIFTTFVPAIPSINPTAQYMGFNSSVVLTALSGNPVGGDGTLKIYITYKILPQ